MNKPKHITWNLSPLLKSDTDPFIQKERTILRQQVERFVHKWEKRTDYLQKPAILKQALDEYENWAAQYGLTGQQGYYFGLRTEQESDNPKLKAIENQIDEFARQLSNQMQFFTMRISRIPQKEQARFLKFKELQPYQHFLRRAFDEAKYLLSEPEEKILTLKSAPAFSNWVRMTSSFYNREEAEVLNEKGKKERLPVNQITHLMAEARDKKVRDVAGAAYNKIIAKHVDVAENELNAIMSDKKINDDLRGLPLPETSRHEADDVPGEVVEALASTVEKSFHLSREFFTLKAKLFKVKKLAYHERHVPYGNLTQKYTFEEAFALVDQVFTQLDPQFSTIINDFKNNGQFDVFPRKGKRGGAFCAHDLKVQPTYILLNYNSEILDVLTIAHECGHGINNELMRPVLHGLNFSTSTATAEVASTFMEDFVLQELLNRADDETRLALSLEKLKEDTASVMGQITLYRFEQELHRSFRKEGYLSKDDIGKLYRKHMKKVLGPSIDYYPGTQYWWAKTPHLRYFFYNYQYASGLLISKSLQNKVKQDPSAIQEVKEFLRAGTSASPYEIFQKMGIDIRQASFWQAGVDEIAQLLKETTALAKKLGKI